MVLTSTASEFEYNAHITSTIDGFDWIMDKYFPLKIEMDREEDGRYIADIPTLPGVLVYGQSYNEAIEKAKQLANNVIRDQQENGELPEDVFVSFVIE